ncbi:nitrite reductase large subunit NirB [Gracilibacillus sp. S3-1-1]|uniref:Nitrite reductase large subunit NirB n=1 Tax=Gracilibacillus pellucidus TaxID=3095368 RepID=A0ACC6M1K3_9BACI|nr:nitrite reductase large subunit NirB [Gracilibacillus sp. S3-1-1]MDX8044819.1 nitrite reductase large subunit NirB [Gracilibacillus sp. S3-1-1]
MKKQHLVMIGNGMAGLRTIEFLLKENSDLYDITIFGSEPYTNYSRIMLSSVLQGEATFADIMLNDWHWYEENNITLYPNETVVQIDSSQQVITTDKERQTSYDKLIIATGSNPFILPLPGNDKDGVMAFRTIDDCKAMFNAAKKHSTATVIGGGLLGLEAARGLLQLNMNVHVVHLADKLLNNQLDTTAAKLLQQTLEQQGMTFHLKKESAEILGDASVKGLRFKDGSIIDTDLVIMAVGIRPNVKLAQSAGLQINRGILVNDYLETNIANIYAVGECVEHRGTVYGLVKPLYEQAEVLAKKLTNNTASYNGSTLYTQLKISGVQLFSVGKMNETSDTKSIYTYDEIGKTYKKVLFEEDKAVGAVLYGDTSLSGKLLDIIQKQKFIPDQKKSTLLQPVKIEESYAAKLPKSEHICTCNSVSKGAIIERVLTNNLRSVNEIKQDTKASSSCGGCKPVVQELLTYMQSDYFHETVKDHRFCTCTVMTEDEVVDAIQKQQLTSFDLIFDHLNWQTTSGCATCQPALHYYLEMFYPERHRNTDFLYVDPKTNGYKEEDGTYTIVPQLYSGKVPIDQLKRISDGLIDYDIAAITLSTDQRIKITGIKKQDVRSLCNALNMTLHSFQPHSLRSIQIPESTLRRDQEKLLSLVEKIESRTEFINFPATMIIKAFCSKQDLSEHLFDLALLQTNGGWELVSNRRILCKTDKEEDIVQLVLAFLQYYRRTANFTEKITQWMERSGIVHIREVLFDDELQQMLREDLYQDQQKRKHSFAHQPQ